MKPLCARACTFIMHFGLLCFEIWVYFFKTLYTGVLVTLRLYENESWANYFTLAKTVSIKYYSAEKLPSSPHQHHRLRESALAATC